MSVCRIFNAIGREIVNFVPEDLVADKITVGRSKDCTIPLTQSEAMISREHFFLRKHSDGWHLIDTSKSGIFKNGEKIKECVLREGDIIRFYQNFFCFGEKTGPSIFELAWRDPKYQIRRSVVIWNGVNHVGSSHDNDVCIPCEQVSRFHGTIKLAMASSRMVYSNRSSMVKTKLNGVDVVTDVELHEGDELEMGGLLLKLCTQIRYMAPVANKNRMVFSNVKVNSARRQKIDWLRLLLWGGGTIIFMLFVMMAIIIWNFMRV